MSSGDPEAPPVPSQEEHGEWHYQWSRFTDDSEFLFRDWIFPNTLESFAKLRVLEAGCGPGHHTRLVAPHCAHITAVDLNTADLAEGAAGTLANVDAVKGDIATMSFAQPFDVVFSVGVIHHTDDPDATVTNLKRLVAPGGRLILWVYAEEGNFLTRWLVELPRRLFLRHLPSRGLEWVAWFLTILVYPFAHTVYRLPLRRLAYYQYMQNWRRLNLRRNMLNVFDKLNAPQTQFISEGRIRRWADDGSFHLEHLSHYVGVSWRLTLRRQD
jgi:SAM-dependent methyltransferase